MVCCSVREDGDTKTRKSRRTLVLPRRYVVALREQLEHQAEDRMQAGN